MLNWNGRDVDRIRRATGLSRARAEALLRRFDGKPDRALEEACGVARVYARPERVVEPETAWQAARRQAAGFFEAARQWLRRAGKRLAALSGLPAALAALYLLLIRFPR